MKNSPNSPLTIELLPALEGDCIVMSYGPAANRRNVLIDGGRASTAAYVAKRFGAKAGSGHDIDLLIVTHVDRDHIEGILALLESPQCPEIRRVWFNGFKHVSGGGLERGARQGERLSGLLKRRQIPWNECFGGGAVAVGAGERIPRIDLDCGMSLTILSPDISKLRKLEPKWVNECRRAGLLPGGDGERASPARRRPPPKNIDIDELASRTFYPDDREPNGSSIAVMAELGGKRVLLAADAHEDRIIRSLQALRAGGPRLAFDLVKVSHHGSAGNISKALFGEIDCSRFVISSDGSHHGLPDAEAVARIVKGSASPCELFFNYQSPFTKPWKLASRHSKKPFSVKYGKLGSLTIEIA